MTTKRKVLFLSGVFLMALGLGYLTYWGVTSWRAKREAEELQSLAFSETMTTETESTPQTSAPETSSVITSESVTDTTEETEPYVSPIDFEALWAVNTDIYAWLKIDDTDISYPILQHPTDNSYYLNHTPERKSGFPGSIFTYNVNAKDFTDFNTVIYGHRMDNGQMFSNLKFYRDETYLKEHRTIRVYLPDRELVYTVFAAVVYDDRLITSYFDNGNPNSCRSYLESIYQNRDLNSHILRDLEVTVEDRVITLSTCIKWEKQNRYLVVAVLTNEIT